MKNLSFVLFGIFLLSACGKSSVDQRRYPVQLYPSDMGKKLFEQAVVTCRNPQDCPSAVGLLTFITSEGAGMCTAFLIAPDLAMTNSHCIADEFRQNSVSIGTRMKLMFPGTTLLASESIPVREIIFFSELTSSKQAIGKRPDYALLRLEKSVLDRSPLLLEQSGFQDNQAFKIYSVTPRSKTAIFGQVEVKPCETMMNSAVQPSYHDPFTPVVSFSGCEVKHGNSGSPMVNAKGAVIGLVHAAVEDPDAVAQALGMQEGDELNLGTNLACVSLPGILTVKESECKNLPPQIDLVEGIKQMFSVERKAELAAKLDQDLSDSLAIWSKQDGAEFPVQWSTTLSKERDGIYAYVIPKCFKANLINAEMDGKFIAPTPGWELKIGFDSKLRLNSEVKPLPLIDRWKTKLEVNFQPKELLTRGYGELEYQSFSLKQRTLTAVGFCL
ncbi:MAG: trypsin-like peptidase domain-containing protein [Bdellovibrionales bacterium]|nr:trypsin-like peptidase domain-containing protein [Oligoflexia bacterium]